MAKTSPSALRMLLEELDSYAISRTKAECIRSLVEAELVRREGTDRFNEFHAWIRKGDQILTELEDELCRLRAITSVDGDHISRTSALAAARALYPKETKAEYDKGMSWILDQIIKVLQTLPGL